MGPEDPESPAASLIQCPACGQANRPGRRFCAQCGVRFDLVCAQCGERNQPGERFCGQCGSAMGAGAVSPATGPPTADTQPATTPKQPAAAPKTPSSFAGGRYRLDRFLGEGARKRVFLARDTRLNREVAIAIVKTEGLDETGLVRVRREAEAMGKLGDHPNVVTVFDVEEDAGQVYIVSRYVSGGDVEQRLRDAPDRRLAIQDALRIATDVARALQHAHDREIVHRDVKPGNVWLAGDGTALLGDFGLAYQEDRSRLTQEGTMLGTVAYMPPEQALGRSADARSDLYSLGATLYEMLTGQPPFAGDDTVGVIAQHINSQAVRPSWHERRVSRELDDLVLKLLAKDSDERPQSAAEVADALAEITRAEADRSRSGHDSRSDEQLPPATLGRFVGRDRELEQLQGVFTRALSGEGSVAMLVGEPGIGKTRLSKEFTVHAKLRGAQVLMGPCYEGEGSVPYQPFVEALRQYVRDRDDDPLRAALGAGAPELANLVPEIRVRFPDLPDAPLLDGEAERQRLFESMAGFVRRAARAAPLVLILDDLHWADKPTLLLLLHLARRIRADRALLVGTYRDVELERTHPLAEVVAKLRNDGLYERVLLRGLSREGVSDLIQARYGQQPPERFVELILRETEGNPFFVEEVIKHLVEIGALRREDGEWVGDPSVVERSIPEGVREVIGHRLTRLSEACNAMLTIGAAMTGGFPFEVLAAVSEEGEEALLDQLDEALRAQVIRERGDGSGAYEFSHALIRQTLYNELSTPRQVRLHRQIAEALEGLYGLDAVSHLGALAYHYFQGAPGGDVWKAIATSQRAAKHAASLLAFEDAAVHHRRALEAFDMLPSGDDARRHELLFDLGNMLRVAGDRAASRKALAEAAAVARRLDDPELLGRTALAYAAEDIVVQFDSSDVFEILEEALAALDPTDSTLRARLLSRLAIGLLFDRDAARRTALASEAVEIARRLGDPGTLCRSLQIEHIILPLGTDVRVNLARSSEMTRLAEAAGDRASHLSTAIFHIMALVSALETELLEHELDRFHRLAVETRELAQLWFSASRRAMHALMCGPFDEARRRLDEARDIGRRGEHPLAEPFDKFLRTSLELFQGPPGPATESALAFWETPLGKTIRIGATHAVQLVHFGRLDEARTIFEETAQRNFSDILRDGNLVGRTISTADVCVALGDAARAAELREMLLPYADAVGFSGPASFCYGPVARTLGRLESLMGLHDEAVAHFELALEKLERLRFRVYGATFRVEFAEALVARDAPGDRDRALARLREALDLAEDLGMKPTVEQALALKLELQGAEDRGVKESIFVVADAVESRRPDLGTHAAPDGTVTLLFSDMEGFTSMTERLGDLRAREVIREHNRIVREQLALHGGYEVELQGDGFLLAFGSARQGLLCAIAIQRAFAEYAAQNPEEPIRVRIGVHTGEALRDSDKFFGKTVILAARIAGEARGGEILASAIVRELTASTGDLRFGSERQARLKGISAPQRLVRLEW
jgi:class 3 adenylate cyclase/KaiC/GvpD/RAD55 family RecA-like ATPase